MSEDSDDRRGRTVPIYDDSKYGWWTEAVRREIASLGVDQKDIATELGVNPGVLSRCISRKIPTVDLLIAISDRLKLPHPVILPESEVEAQHLARQRRLVHLDLQAEQTKPPSPPKRGAAPTKSKEKRKRT